MSLYAQWNAILQGEGWTNAQSDEFWTAYLSHEKSIYERLLGEKINKIEGTLKSFAEANDLEPTLALGFIDGIHTSFEESIDLENMDENTELNHTINFEKLFFNMHQAKADWLYGLEAWQDILSAEDQKRIKEEYQESIVYRAPHKLGRNEPCICGSGKKYKKCCLGKDA